MEPSCFKNYLIVDTHVHIYPKYDLKLFFERANKNLNKIATQQGINPSVAFKLLCLTERLENNFFDSLKESLGKLHDMGLDVEFHADGRCAKITNQNSETIFILRGFQTVSKEGLEVLSLVANDRPNDGAPIRQIISEIKSKNGVAVIPWSPGKWLGKRGKVVKALIEELSPSDFLIGDISMRPKCSPNNVIFKLALLENFRMLAGSDPLPSLGEEDQVGSYALLYRSIDKLSESEIVSTFISKLKNESPSLIGSRNSFYTALRRWIRARI